MIYLDNAATTFPKPPETEQAMVQAVRALGNAGRGAHEASLAASRILFTAREQLAAFFHAESSSRIAFAQNTTQALNTALFGVLNPGDHVITTACEHNSVLRPLYLLEERGVTHSILRADRQGRIDYGGLDRALRPNTRAIIVTHASNLTGNVTDLERMADFASRHGLLLIVDAAQTAGILPIDVQAMHIDILCFPGHKGLYGPQGTGGLYVKPGLTVHPLFVGGSGFRSYEHTHPKEMPAALEAGTQNAHGIAGLSGGLSFLKKTGTAAVRKREDLLARRFYAGVHRLPGVTLYGDFTAYETESTAPGRVATIALNIGDLSSAETADLLSSSYGIETRAGAHCAPLMHEALGTKERGAVRFSFSYFNTEDETDAAVRAVREISESVAG